MEKAILGTKIGMTQIFGEGGVVIPVTVVMAGPCVVTQKKTVETDGYEAVQVGFGDVKEKHLNKPQLGHFKKADTANKKYVREFRLDDCESLNVGDEIKADIFAAGDKVDVSGISKETRSTQRSYDSRFKIKESFRFNGYVLKPWTSF